MAIFDDEIVINSGLLKEVDAEGMPILMDVIQKDLYNYPIESSVRETFSNGVDSIAEKLMAIAILNGTATIEDYYTESDRTEAKASKFDPAYYDIKWLDANTNFVEIIYHKGFDNGKDMIFFKDMGVGLAGKRLEGFFRPGFSSKRLNKEMLGKYGLGSKSALSTNIEFYVLESWYNGYYTKVLIYDDYFKCVIPESVTVKKDKIYGKKLINNVIVDSFDYINWSSTDRKNGVTVAFHAKSHNEVTYITAVQKQLMYFTDELDFSVIDHDGYVEKPYFKVEILLDTPLFIISNNNFYSVPHILINKVNYSIIDFSELEMNKKYGSIAVKAGSNDVDMNASRETVRWTAKTKKFIQSVTEAASVMTTELLEKELQSVENPFKRASLASSWKIQRSGSKQEQIIEQLKNFSGASEISVKVNPSDYMDKSEIPSSYAKSIFNVSDFYTIFSDCKPLNIDINSYSASVIKPGLRNMDWTNCVYRFDNEKVETIRINEAAYIRHITGYAAFSHIGVPDKKYPIQSYEEYKQDYIDEKKSIASKSDSADVYIKKMYVKYVGERAKNAFLLKLFKKILVKHGVEDPSTDIEGLKKFVKDNFITSDSSLVCKDNSVTRYDLKRKDSRLAKKEEYARLKKEKKAISIKSGRYNYTNRVFDYSLMDISVDAIPDITYKVIYAFQEERELLDFMGSFIGSSNQWSRKELHEGSVILIARENLKFFNLDNFVHINNVIKTMHTVDKENNKLSLTFGPEIKKIMTSMKIAELTKTFPLALIAVDYGLIKYIKTFLPKYGRIFELCNEYMNYLEVAYSDFKSSTDLIENITFKYVSTKTDRQKKALIVEFLSSLYDISKIQELPMSELTGSSKELVNAFESVDVCIYDKETIDEFVKVLEDNSEVIIKAIARYSVERSLSILSPFIDSKFHIEVEEENEEGVKVEEPEITEHEEATEED